MAAGRSMWSGKSGRPQRTLRLRGRTSGERVTTARKAGFGTKLIDMNITRELDGTICADFHEDGLQIEIEIPLVPSEPKPAAEAEQQ